MILVILVLIVIPVSFAGDDVDTNQTQEVLLCEDTLESIDENDDIVQVTSEIYVNAENGTVGGSGTKDNPVKHISEALNRTGDEGTIYLTGKFSGTENSNFTFDKNSKIDFIGVDEAVIDGNHATSFAKVNEGSYTFNNISFTNHYKTGGAMMLGGVFENAKESTLTFNNCLFENNTVFGVTRGNGGAIDNMGTLIINECIFKNNQVNISNSSGFRKNAADGGAISNLGVMQIYNSIFESNTALRNGGAIRTQDGAKTRIENSEFRNNLAAYHLSGGSYGGAIYTWDCGLDVYNSTFIGNRIIEVAGNGAQGGAIFSERGNELINIKNCEFINNTATGKGAVLGQSIYIGAVSENVNYCYIDTSIYCSSQNVNLDYNWWDSNNARDLIENLPSSVKIDNCVQLKLSTDADEIHPGDTVNIFVKLVWDKTNNQENINKFSPKAINLTADCGILAQSSGIIENGLFNTTLTVTNLNNAIVRVNVGRMSGELNLSGGQQDYGMFATAKDISEGESALIQIFMNKNATGICLIDIGENKHYAILDNNMANAYIKNLNSGVYNVSIAYLGDENNAPENTTVTLTVKESTKVKTDTKLDVSSKITLTACDYSVGEKGNFLNVVLKDANGKTLAGKTVQIALNGKIHDVTTDKNGKAKLAVNNLAAKKYDCVISFGGDESYNPAPLKLVALNVVKKSSKISAASKTFKAKATKTVKVTLKTVKNSDGKTYLKKGKKITLTVKGKKYTAKTNAKGVAKFTIKLTKKGKYTASIKFNGDSIYKSCKKSIKITIK